MFGEFVLYLGFEGNALRNPLCICFATDEREEQENQLVSHVAQGRIKWVGPVVVLRYAGIRMEEFVDVSENDLRDVSGFFAFTPGRKPW